MLKFENISSFFAVHFRHAVQYAHFFYTLVLTFHHTNHNLHFSYRIARFSSSSVFQQDRRVHFELSSCSCRSSQVLSLAHLCHYSAVDLQSFATRHFRHEQENSQRHLVVLMLTTLPHPHTTLLDPWKDVSWGARAILSASVHGWAGVVLYRASSSVVGYPG